MNKNLEKSKTFFIAILLLSLVGFISMDFYLPSLPAITSFFETTKKLSMLTFSVYLATYALSQIFYGPYSERFGRKKVALFGISIGFLGTLVCLFSFSIQMLFIGRLLQGLGMGAGAAIFRTVLRDAFEGTQLARFGSFMGVATSIATAGAPTLGGFIQNYFGWRANFVFLALYIILSGVVIKRWLPETNLNLNPDATRPKIFLKNYLHLLTHPVFLGYSCCTSLVFGGIAGYLAVSPFLFQEVIGLSPVQYGLLSFFLMAGMLVGGLLNSKLVKKFGPHRMLVTGVVILFIASLALLILGLLKYLTTLAIMIPMAFYVVGAGFSFANTFAGAFTPFAKIAGFAGGLYGCIQMVGGSVLSALVAKLPNQTQIPLGFFLIAIAIAAYFLQMLAFRYAVKHHPHP